MMTDDQFEMSVVRSKVVDVIHLLACVFGAIAVVSGIEREIKMGDFKSTIASLAVLVVLLVVWAVRRKISIGFRSVVALSMIGFAGFANLWIHGAIAMAGILLPTTVVVGWLIWQRNGAMVYSLAGLAAYWAAGWAHITSSPDSALLVGGYDRLPSFWWNVFFVYVLFSALLLGTTRVLLGSMRVGWKRAREGERLARAEKERLDGILRGVNDSIFLQDLDSGAILEVHGRCEEMYGLPREKILTMDVGMLSAGFAPWTSEDAARWLRKCVEQGPQVFPWRAKRGNGDLFWVEVAMRIVMLQGLERLLVTVRDIDASMRTQLELASLNADLERRVLLRTAEIQREREASDAFSYTVSHDLRSPLRAIDGFSRILQEDFHEHLPAEANELIARIVNGAGRMGRLIEALLSLSRLDRYKIDRQTVDVGRIVRDTKDELLAAGACAAHVCGENAVVWEFGELPDLEADSELVRQVFANLMGNACKFTRTTAAPRIVVRSLERDDGIWYEISDNGMGFEMEYAGKLFHAFHRLQDASVEGIGIGLATVKKIVDRFGGAIEAEGRVDGGAKFRFRLSRSLGCPDSDP